MSRFIPVNTPLIDGKEREYLSECIETGWISSEGPFVKQFEKQFAGLIGRKHAIAVSNGSAALEVAIAALNIKAGDEVILPTFTIISCMAPLMRQGIKPVFIDADPLTWNMEVGQIESKITSRTKCIMVVHIYGLPVDMDPVLSLAEKHGIKIIEDAAEAHGLRYKGKICGSFGDVSTFSFYPNKLITTGEGGMIVTDNDNIAEKCRSFRNLCFQDEKRFIHEELGWNCRMSNVQAALGLAQLERLDEFIGKKIYMGQKYTELLSDIDNIQLPCSSTDYAENIYWIYGIVLKENLPFNADTVMEALKKRGIGTRPFFWPLHEQPVFQKSDIFHNASCPVAERIARKGFYVPSGLGLKKEEMDMVACAVKDVLSSL